MKILVLIPRDGISGGIIVSYIQAQALFDAGEDIKIAFVHESRLPIINHIKLTVPLTLLNTEIAAHNEYDVVIATWWETFYDAMKVKAKRVLYFCQSDERRFYPPEDPNRLWVQNTYIHKEIGVITEAKWIQKLLRKEFGLNVEYAPNGIDLEIFNTNVPPLKPKSDRVRVLIEGPGDVWFKKVDLAFEVVNRFPEVEVWYVSSTDFIQNTWKFDEHFVRVPYSKMPRIYSSCDILVKLSSVEGFFGPPLEMMACGGTALVSNVTGHDEYIKDGYNAMVVPMDDPDAAEHKLRLLIQNKNLRNNLIKNGIKTAQGLAWNIQTPKFRKAIYQLVRKTPITSSYTRTRVLTEDFYRKEFGNILRLNKILSLFIVIYKKLRWIPGIKWLKNRLTENGV